VRGGFINDVWFVFIDYSRALKRILKTKEKYIAELILNAFKLKFNTERKLKVGNQLFWLNITFHNKHTFLSDYYLYNY
jgi:hypothetical protein